MPNTINASNKLTCSSKPTSNSDNITLKLNVNLEELYKLANCLAEAQVTIDNLIGIEDKETYCPDDSVLQKQSFAISEARKFIERLKHEALIYAVKKPLKQNSLHLEPSATVFDIGTVLALNPNKDLSEFKEQTISLLTDGLTQQAHNLRIIAILLTERKFQPETERLISETDLIDYMVSVFDQQADISDYYRKILSLTSGELEL